jgi:lipid II:glycine glycyltransferase (peptidoglycan interpeptide bridge formation enzyme)
MIEVIDMDNESWMNYVRNHEKATIFHSPAWANMLAHCYNRKAFVLGDFNENGAVTAGIPVIENQHILGKTSWMSLPYTDHCEPLSNGPEQEVEFSNDLVHFLQTNRNTSYEFRWAYPEVPFLHPRKEFVYHKLSLSKDFAATAGKIHPMHKRNAQTAIKRNVTVITSTDEEHLKEFYKLHIITRQRKGVPVQPWHFFRHLGEDLLQKKLGFIMLAYQEDTCLAAAIFLLWNKTMTYKFGASNPDDLHLRPNDLIFRNAIQWGCENGYSTLDFGRTDIENKGLRDYKSRWGAVESDLYYSYAPGLPQHRPSWMIDILSQIIMHSPKSICRLSGELLYRFAD